MPFISSGGGIMEITIAVIVSADGYIISERNGIEPSYKQALSRLRSEADMELHPNASLLMLLTEKQNEEDISYFVELTTCTLNLIQGLQRYRLIDKVCVQQTKDVSGNGILFSDVLNLDSLKND